MTILSEDLTVYSCMTGDYDDTQEDGRIYVPASNRFHHNRMNAKVPKILSHKYTSTEWSVWVDSNIIMRCTYIELIKSFLAINPDLQVGIFTHPERTQTIQEIEECKRIGLDEQDRLDYHKGRGDGEKLGYCGIIVRRNTDLVAQYNEKWWAEITRGSSRDQCSFPYTLGKIATYKDLEPHESMLGNLHQNNKFYQRSGHKKGNTLQ